MSHFFVEQVEHIFLQIRCEIPSYDGHRIRRRFIKQAMEGQARVFGEAYFLYAAAGNTRRTPLNGKMAIYEWTIIHIDKIGRCCIFSV